LVGSLVVAVFLRDSELAVSRHTGRGPANGSAGATSGHDEASGAVAALERPDRSVHTATDTRPALAGQRRTLGSDVNVTGLPVMAESPITGWLPGTRFMIFGGVAELIAVEHDPLPAFPHARLITVRPGAGGAPIFILVPADFEPLVLPCHTLVLPCHSRWTPRCASPWPALPAPRT
jgi:hypothetical protein